MNRPGWDDIGEQWSHALRLLLCKLIGHGRLAPKMHGYRCRRCGQYGR